MNNMDMLEHVVVKVPCACGDGYDVPLRHVLESQELVHESERMWDAGCPNYCREATCELVQYAALVDEGAARHVERSVATAFDTLTRAGVDVEIACR